MVWYGMVWYGMVWYLRNHLVKNVSFSNEFSAFTFLNSRLVENTNHTKQDVSSLPMLQISDIEKTKKYDEMKINFYSTNSASSSSAVPIYINEQVWYGMVWYGIL